MGNQLPMETGTAAPTFRPMSIVAKRSPISATAELLFKTLLADVVNGPAYMLWVLRLRVCNVISTNIPTTGTFEKNSKEFTFAFCKSIGLNNHTGVHKRLPTC